MDEDILAELRANDLGRIIEPALSRLLAEDSFLLEVDANERSVTHRLGMYLQDVFPDYSVDCEYNRDGHEPKQVFGLGDAGAHIYPDIIVHRRGTNDNLLVVEVKLTSNQADPEYDRQKLQRMKVDLGYPNALFLVLRVGERYGLSEIEWIDVS